MEPRSFSPETLREILEADSRDLGRLLLLLEPDTTLYFYARSLAAYWKSDIDALKIWQAAATDLKDNGLCHYLIRLRLAVRECTAIVNTVTRPPTPHPLWLGELCFVEAMLAEVNSDDATAMALYLDAQKHFYREQALRKAAKSYHNAIACESRLHPEKRHVTEYQEASRLAREAGDAITEGAALCNLSREFHLMNATRMALQYANESIQLLRESAYGSYNFYHSLTHRCQLHLELEQLSLATLDFEEASPASFPEIKNSLGVLEKWIGDLGLQLANKAPALASGDAAMLPTWQERQTQGLEQRKNLLSQQETLVIAILSQSPRDKFELIESLWGDNGSFFDLENRLKQLLYRLRKKRPNLIGFEEGKYHLLDEKHRIPPPKALRH